MYRVDLEEYIKHTIKPSKIFRDVNRRIYYIDWVNDDKRHHREDGPARMWASGSEEWFFDGRPHRLDGPASTYFDGERANQKDPNPAYEWYIDGKKIHCRNQEEFKKLVKLMAFW